MNKIIVVSVAIVAGISLFIGGFFLGRANAQPTASSWMMGDWNDQVSPGMMRGQVGPDMMNSQYGPGMGRRGMMNGQYGCDGNPTGRFGTTPSDVESLSLEEAETAVTDYLAALDEDNLELGEIMIFDNHAYAQIINESTGTGTFEVLVDPVTKNVFLEPGPNMMWNTEYGMMGNGVTGMGRGSMMGGGRFGYAPDAESDVTADEAVNLAQAYLNAHLPGATADEHADAFPGYYTLHTLQDGEVTGMLSVNAATGQVFLHHWHGEFIEMAGADHD
jgi:hypothetical protein